MKSLSIAAILLTLLLFSGACTHQNKEKSDNKKAIDKKADHYFCTMDPEITSDKPGICNKCGMPLVEKDTTAVK